MNRLKSVKTKIILMVVSLVMISSLITGLAGIYSFKRTAISDSSQIMNLFCTNKADEIDALLARIEQSVQTLEIYSVSQITDARSITNNPAYVNELVSHLVPMAVNSAENTEGALTVYIRFNPKMAGPESGLFYSRDSVGTKFKELPPTNILAYDETDIEHVGWFYEPANQKSGMWMEPYYNKNINVEMISYVMPMYIEQTFVGVVGMDIDFSIIEQVTSNMEVYNTGYAFLTDANANIIYHRDLKKGTSLTAYNNGEFSKMAIALQGNDSDDTLLEYTYQGVPKKLSYRTLSNNMRLMLSAPVSEIDGPANRLILQIIIEIIIIVAITVVLIIIFTRHLVKPLLELTTAAQKIAEGDLSVSITHVSNDEVGKLAESFRQTVKHLQKYISYINELAYRDPLTGVKNKTAYLDVVKQLEEQIRLKRPEFAVIVFDLNGLKTINDTYGHDFGDMMIADACKIISSSFRRSAVYRIGGDEFVVILENSDYEKYGVLLEDFQDSIEQYNNHPHNDILISIAKGIAIYSYETDLNFNDVFKRADSAMYHNKMEMKQKLNT